MRLGQSSMVGAGIVLAVLVSSCAPAAPDAPRSTAGQAEISPTRGPSRVVAAMMGEPSSLVARFNTGQISVPGAGVLEQLVNASLSEYNDDGGLQPQLAEAVPSLENGLWKLFPDGRMETTWKIRAGATWHDGTPVTGDDFVFSTVVDQDKDTPIQRPPGYSWVEKVEAPDARTVTVTWNRPYIDADAIFTYDFATPLARHLLADVFQADKTRFVALPYWNTEFVGTGPFRVKEFNPGSSVTIQAFDGYVLGRPKIDEIEVRFILDLNTVITNLISGTAELTIGRGFAIEQAVQLRDQWRDGHMIFRPRSWIALFPQFIDPSPAIIADQRFRRALMYGTDRQQLVDTLQAGLVPIGNIYLSPSEPEYKEVESRYVRYDYDPRRATQMIEDLGYSRGSDGVYRDPAGQRLAVEVRSNGEPITEKAIVPVANFWTQLGVAADPVLVPPQRQTDREYVATFPSFRMMRQPNTASQISRSRSSQTPTAENRYVGSNYARYSAPEFDALIDRFLTTIPKPERIRVFGDIMYYMSDQLNQMGLFHDGEFMFASNRLQHVSGGEIRVWDVHLWEAK